MARRILQHGDDAPFSLEPDFLPQFTVLPSSGTADNGKPIYSWDRAAAQITRDGDSWSFTLGTGITITYAFRASAPAQMPEDTGGFSRFSTTQIAVTLEELHNWAEVANINFVRVDDGNGYSNNAAILIRKLFDRRGCGSRLRVSGGGRSDRREPEPRRRLGQFGAAPITLNRFLEYGPQVLLHEIGHALGLEHPGDYNANLNYHRLTPPTLFTGKTRACSR